MSKVEQSGVLELSRHATFLLVGGELVRCELIIQFIFEFDQNHKLSSRIILCNSYLVNLLSTKWPYHVV